MNAITLILILPVARIFRKERAGRLLVALSYPQNLWKAGGESCG
jgi:hypothetical protein